MVRLPQLAMVQFPEEKTECEAATANYIEKNTLISTPKVLHSGEDPKLGFYVIIEYIEHKSDMHTASSVVVRANSDVHDIFNPNIDREKWLDLWFQTARCYLDISQLTFPL